jgi:hypothetical protein
VPVWKRIRPGIESAVQERRNARLAREREALIEGRKAEVRKYYRNYCLLKYRSKPIKEFFLLPRDWDVFQIESVARVIHREDREELSSVDEDVVELKANLPNLVQNWMDARTLDMAGKLPLPIASTSNTGGHDAAIMARRQLTLSVFRCGTPSCLNGQKGPLIGWEDAIAHHCYISEQWSLRMPKMSSVEYDPRGSAAVASIAQLFNLDPRNTLPSAIDQLDPRIVCTNCPQPDQGRLAFPWREAVRSFAYRS